MARLCLVLAMIVLLAFAPGAQVEAQMQSGPPPATGSPKLKGKRVYDPANIVIVSGTVTEVRRIAPLEPNERAIVVLVVKTPQRVFRVLMGPAAYVDRQPVKIVAGDQVEVNGFRVTTRRMTRIIAIQVRKGNQVLRLRDANGHALWRGMKKPGI
ncbi:MAG: hypothetical protein PHU44_08120 [Syntrophales bacterium]|nr:hypothetical protein [Syntrophales bacterium]